MLVKYLADYVSQKHVDRYKRTHRSYNEMTLKTLLLNTDNCTHVYLIHITCALC